MYKQIKTTKAEGNVNIKGQLQGKILYYSQRKYCLKPKRLQCI